MTKPAILTSTDTLIVIRAGTKGKGRIVASQALQAHRCNAGCRCSDVRDPIIERLIGLANREGFTVRESLYGTVMDGVEE
jgi:hypothetical protein